MSQMPYNPLLASLGEPLQQLAEKQPEQLESSSHDRLEVIESCRNSLDFFAALVLPAVVTLSFPSLYNVAWGLLTSKACELRDYTRLALGLPRGFTKTTLMKLLIVWCILLTNKKFFLIIGATAARAESILSDVADMLDEANVRNTFGDWRVGLEKDTQTEKVFGFRGRSIIICAMGAGGDLRGINRKHARPDFVLMDDMQTRENAKSPVLSNALLEWMAGTLMKTKSNFGCLFLFVGNMYPYPGSILRQLRKNPTWKSMIVGALLADGESIWPELRSREDLLDEFTSDLALGKPEIFLSEVLNDEDAAVTCSIDVSKIPREPVGLSSALAQGSFIVIDPSGRKNTSDNTAIGHFSIFDVVPMLDKVIEGVMSPMQTIKAALQLALETNCSLIAVEAVAYQETLLYWFELISQNLGIAGIDFVAVHPGSLPKNSRIKVTLGRLVATDQSPAEVLIADSVRSPVLNEAVRWNPLRKDNKDELLDLLWYAPVVIADYGHLAAIRGIIDSSDYATARVYSLQENCTF